LSHQATAKVSFFCLAIVPYLNYLTFFRFGFFFLAVLLALRVLAAKIAEAPSLEMPCFLAMPAATALNPGCFFIF